MRKSKLKRSKRQRSRREHSRPARHRRFLIAKIAAAAVFLAVLYGIYLSWVITAEFASRGWDLPAQIYAAPLELYAGRRLSPDDMLVELRRLGYRESSGPLSVGTYQRGESSLRIWSRGFERAGSSEAPTVFELSFAGGRIDALRDAADRPMAVAQLDPMLIGSVFPAHGEDRIIVAPDEIPPVLSGAIIAVEDRRFERHIGIDFRGIARAALVDLRSGELRQGGSTLTQQLIRSYFLTNDQTWRRKISEAFMAVALELRHSKQELMHAYINEVYLGQDGDRAVHGFGLASRFYFGKPLGELELHEIALLVAQVRGPSYYDPRRHPERALERRDLVLAMMRDQGIIDADAAAAATERELGIADAAGRQLSYYAAFLDLLRRQLRRDYAAEDLERKGIRVFSTLDPSVQASAEAALTEELDRLQPGRPALEGAVIVTNTHSAEIRAIVGSRRTGYNGFNRALDASRQVGSLIKPAVYLAALESGRHSFASLISDAPIEIPLDDGSVWAPANFDRETHGVVTAVRALAESFNLATVRLGMDVGIEAVADTLVRLGADQRPALYPSLLLGALQLTPLEVTQIYNTLANGGFRAPLRTVREVVDADGVTLQRYPLQIQQAADATSVYALNQALVQVMERGTARGARRALPPQLRTAGKTGTSDDLRDSWFAGFSNDRLIVAWVGNDANEPTGLTGSSGAARVWSRALASLDATAYEAPPPGSAATAWIDYNTGLTTDGDCPDAVFMAMTSDELPPKAVRCGSDRARGRARARRWSDGVLE